MASISEYFESKQSTFVWLTPLLGYAVFAALLKMGMPAKLPISLVGFYSSIGFDWSPGVGEMFSALLIYSIVQCFFVWLLSQIFLVTIGFENHDMGTFKYSLIRAVGFFLLVIFASGAYGKKLSIEKITSIDGFAITAVMALIFGSVFYVLLDAIQAFVKVFLRGNK